MKIEISHNFLFSKNAEGKYNHILSIDKKCIINPLYNKEVYIPDIKKNRDVLSQALGYTGCYANNYFDSTTHYILLPDSTIDNFQFGIKDKVIEWVESTCEEQKAKAKDPKRWKFNMTFVLENEVIEFITNRAKRVNEECILELLKKY